MVEFGGRVWRRLLPGIVVTILLLFSSQATSQSVAKAIPKSAVDSRDMKVYWVRSAEPGCGQICPEWIVARGNIVPSTPKLFRKLFRQIGKRHLPVILDSGGGSVEAALSIGKMVREHQLDVIVGSTSLSTCSSSVTDCSVKHRDGEPYLGYQVIWSGTCASACPIILAGGVRRMAFGDAIGAHQVVETRRRERIRYRDTFTTVNGRKKLLRRSVISRQIIVGKPTTDVPKSYYDSLRKYFSAMGVSPAYVDFFARATPDKMYFLTSAERFATKITNADPPKTGYFDKSTCLANPPAEFCVKRP